MDFLDKGIVYLWQAQLADFFDQEVRLIKILDKSEIERAEKMSGNNKVSFIITRGLLRMILSTYSGVAPDKIKFFYGPYGKPYLSDYSPTLQFNVSHSNSLSVYAITFDQEVGVDVEKVASDFNIFSIAENFLSPYEYKQVSKLSELEQTYASYNIWSKKEAIVKALGLGLSVPLNKFSVSLNLARQKIELIHNLKFNTLYIERLYAGLDYTMAIATSLPIKKIIYKNCLMDIISNEF